MTLDSRPSRYYGSNNSQKMIHSAIYKRDIIIYKAYNVYERGLCRNRIFPDNGWFLIQSRERGLRVHSIL